VRDVFDIAILGAGPAGGNAALASVQQGLRTVLLDEQPSAGGQVWRARSASILAAPETPESRAGAHLRSKLSTSDITYLKDARVWQIAREGDIWQLQVLSGGQSDAVEANALILATGAREFVQPVPGWTTPGVIGLAGATALFKQNLTLPGRRTVVSGTGPLLFYVASEIRRLGGEVAAVVTPNTRADWLRALPALAGKPRLLGRGALWIADLMLARVPIYWGHAVTEVLGHDAVSDVKIARLDAEWAPQKHVATIGADSLCLGNGLIPQIEPAQMLGVPIHYDAALGGWVPDVSPDGVTTIASLYLCGDGTGIRGANAAALQGRLVGLRVAADLGRNTQQARTAAQRAWRRAACFGRSMTVLSVARPGLQAVTSEDTIICRCESITRRQLLEEIDKGAASANAVKSGLRVGMGPCGGKFCQTAIAALIAKSRGRDVSTVAPPTARPPLRPVPLGAAAGSFDYDDLPIPKPAPL